ncbi:MAG: hypothetical protein E6G94_10750 [Alphaproteobacteria bacterium]|nr:MAG: hypothetical protein E6G94_10750 [Alphaproteobacteria bacterium]
MGSEHDAMMVVRAELCERLVSLRTLAGSKRGGNVGESIEGIRRLAAAYGMNPVVRLADALERSVRETGRPGACGPSLYLDQLRDAIGCERCDEQAVEAMLASVAIRLGA